MTTPTDQELEKVAREAWDDFVGYAERQVKDFTLRHNPRLQAAFESVFLSALKQVQPTKDLLLRVLFGAEYFGSVEVRRGPAWPEWVKWQADLKELHTILVDSIAVSPRERVSADAQNVGPTNETREDSSDRLASCPFCGGTNANLVIPHGGEPVHWAVICAPDVDKQGCGASGTWELSRTDAIAKWNRRVPPPASTRESEFVDGLIREGEKRQGIKHTPPASTPANPPKEGRASAESGKDWTHELQTMLKNFVTNFTDEELAQAFKDTDFEIYRRSKPESCVPNIDTQRLDCGMDNVLAWRLGEVTNDPQLKMGGDLIDRGLILRRLLEEKGFWLVPIDAMARAAGGP